MYSNQFIFNELISSGDRQLVNWIAFTVFGRNRSCKHLNVYNHKVCDTKIVQLAISN